MKQILQGLKDGTTQLADVAAPRQVPGQLLIHTRASLISAGTERTQVDFGAGGVLVIYLPPTLSPVTAFQKGIRAVIYERVCER